MKRPRLRSMLLVPIVITMTVGFAAFAVYIDRVEASNRLADIDDELVRAERTFQLRDQPPGAADAPGGAGGGSGDQPTGNALPDDVEPPMQLLVRTDGEILASGASQKVFDRSLVADLATRSGVFTVDEPRHRVLVTPRPNGSVQITALALGQLDDAVRDFRQTLFAGGIAMLILQAFVVWLLSGRLIRPVTRIAATANRIADGELDTEIDPADGSREMSDLAFDLERMVAQLRTTIEDRERLAVDATAARDDMRRFLADASHELRTPLTALKGYSDLYAGNMLDEPGALDRAMDRIGAESHRLSLLVCDMLALAREAPTNDQLEVFDPGETVRSIVADLQAAHAEVPIELEMVPDAERLVLGHPYRLHQAILNVGSNACQHTEPRRGVKFVVAATKSDVVIDVVDHGPGIDPAEIDKIFLPFYRPQTSRDRDGRGGAGLGLAITHQIVERLGGTVAVAATPGGGATLTLTLPLAAK